MDNEKVLTSVCDGIAKIVINQPEVGNAMTVELFQMLKDTVDSCAAAPHVRVLVLTGAGKNFSAGGSIPEFCEMVASGGEMNDAVLLGAEALSLSVRQCPKPVIAQVNGAAAGAGCGLALAADFRIMTPKSKLVPAFANLAVPGDSFTTYYLCKMVGISRATKYMMAGVPISAEEALHTGIAHAVVGEQELDGAAMQLARKLAAGPQAAYACQKAYLLDFLLADLDAVAKREFADMKACSRLPDFSEALTAFREKRTPVFNKSS